MVKIEDNFYTLQMVRSNPNQIYVFGDNVDRWGKRGQAIIRDESNAFGVATKRRPHTSESSYFSDKNPKDYANLLADLDNLRLRLQLGATLVFPRGGLGTGLSKMPEKCPGLFVTLNDYLLMEFGISHKGPHYQLEFSS